MTTQLEPVEVTQADREAANDFRAAAIARLVNGEPGGWKDTPDDYLVKAFARHRVATAQALEARVRELEVEKYASFTDGMEAGAQICGSLAETTYDDTDAFEAATGCEAAIMKVVKQQRKEQSEARAALKGIGHE